MRSFLNFKTPPIIIAATVLILACEVSSSRACTCLPPSPPAQAVAEADAVFLAKVISFEEMPARSERRARLAVIKIWKGRPAEADSVFTALNSAACGYDFQVGETYLIYADKRETGQLWTHLCTRTAHISEAGEDLDYLASFSLFPLAVGNYWQFAEFGESKTEKILDTLRLDGRLYYRIDHFREFNDALLHLSGDGKLMLRADTLEQVWVDFNADFNESWHVKGPFNPGDEWEVRLVSREDTVRTKAGTFFPCLRFHFRFAGADNDWQEWYFPNLGTVQRLLLGIAPFNFPLESAYINGKNFPSTVGKNPPSSPPQIFRLSQNHPNPFAVSAAINAGAVTRIHYELQKPAAVTLTIVDALGRQVKTLAEGMRPAGEHQALWDGRDQSGKFAGAGIYFYRLSAQGATEMKKLILIQ